MRADLGIKPYGIAHGDLQHGNILVLDSGIKLVDYDGMFVPDLSGEESPELGHRNYQHPKRKSSDYFACLDNFSAWLIYITLICLSEDSRLWQELDGGDDKLIFAESDLNSPVNSHRFYSLEHHENTTICSHCRFLRSLLELEIEEIPFLDADLVEQTILPDFEYEALFPSGTMRASRMLHAQGSMLEEGKIELAAPGASTPGAIKPRFTLFQFLSLFGVGLVVFFSALNSIANSTLDTSQLDGERTIPIKGVDAENLSKADSLEKQADKASNDGATRFAISLYKEAIAEFQKQETEQPTSAQSTERSLAYCWHSLGHCYETISEGRSAYQAYGESYTIYKKLGDSERLHTLMVDEKTLHWNGE